ncbi:hypothetical protein KBY85_06385 [Cyanobium sp. BA5m-10]|uniref:hypothetical protein n=1 Tax=Cyanobium sp. BA5m-10 TaxID=2823705 RepID=UPI0020CE8006|nr:hypothetical protein [Cyanobium sp. BA5m-10]MCP9903765.1 hypothetical protein [Cyanobium sp. BA5m-10]
MNSDIAWYIFFISPIYFFLWFGLDIITKNKLEDGDELIGKILLVFLKLLEVGGLILALLLLLQVYEIIKDGYYADFKWESIFDYSGMNFNMRRGLFARFVLMPIISVVIMIFPILIIAYSCVGLSIYIPALLPYFKKRQILSKKDTSIYKHSP